MRCPKCGQGRVLKGYLTKHDQCPNCGESFEGLNADDGPAWFTMFFVGLFTIPLLIALGVYNWFSMPFNIAIICVYITLLSLILLPPTKGIFIAILWYLRENK
ncbi:MAG: DUF983 domain-containing protein [Alphaproteobacteria bacterium]|nr:DUF983 domain-containing protein [Alphaproteobacteria bacterium]NCQ88116.1 DUF983 domain-containing protein [Alphaproteobacteria bacterium]NCT05377.1 DUF983 domain-containing protein [Alphaproteobacteria bacterium]